MKDFLNREDAKKILLFKYIEEYTQQTASFSAITSELGFSEFVLLRTVENLIKDIEINELNLYFKIEINRSEKKIKLKKNKEASISSLYLIYLKSSLTYNILVDILSGRFNSMMEFALNNFTSYPAVYKKVQEIKKELDKYDIHLSSKYDLVGDEISIRMFFYNLYYPRFNEVSYPFEEKYRQLSKLFIRLLENYFDLGVQETLKTKINYFLAISLKRIDKRQYLVVDTNENKKNFSINRKHDLYKMVYSFIRKEYPSIEKKTLISEVDSIVAFLISEDYVKRKKFEICGIEIDSLIKYNEDITTLFTSEFEKYFKKSIEQQQYDFLVEELQFLHFKLNFFKNVENIFGYTLNLKFMEDTYVDAAKFCEEFVTSLPNTRKYEVIKRNKNFIFYQYLFLVIQTFSSDFFMETIHICLDFSLGNHYTSVIETNLKSFNFFNIQVERHMNKKTNLFISDYSYKGIQIPFLIWNIPPTAKDWANLGEFLVLIKKEKTKKVKE